VDWLAEVAYMKMIANRVFQSAVNLVDRYLTMRTVDRNKLQLLGITCLLIAAKTHVDARNVAFSHILTVRESSWLTDSTYSYEDVVKMMGEVIGALRGELWKPTSCDYLELMFHHTSLSDEQKEFGHFINDMSLQYIDIGRYKPSLIAGAVFILTKIMFNELLWTKEMEVWTGFQVKDLAHCAATLYHNCFVMLPCLDDRDIPLKSIKEEFSSDTRFRVATLKVPDVQQVSDAILIAANESVVSLSISSLQPLTFVPVLPACEESHKQVRVEPDDTFNVSTRSVDYDGDSEDCGDAMDSSSDEGSFCVGRSCYASYLSMDEFSDNDDETQTKTGQISFNDFGLDKSIHESFHENLTPMLPTISDKIALNLSNTADGFGKTRSKQSKDSFKNSTILDSLFQSSENECNSFATKKDCLDYSLNCSRNELLDNCDNSTRNITCACGPSSSNTKLQACNNNCR